MRKRILAAVLCLCMLAGMCSAYAAAGGEGDPLISLSYILEVFKPKAKAAFSKVAENVIAERTAEDEERSATKTVGISGGGRLTLECGQYFVLLSGTASLKINSGEVVNASVGKPAAAGDVKTGSRYIACEDTEAELNILEDARIYCSSRAEVTPGDGKVSPFKDVKRGDWFFNSVVGASELGLISGMTATTYEPSGPLTLAQAIRLAAALNEKYLKGTTTVKKSETGPWYQSFVDYCYENDIIDGTYANLTEKEYNAPVNRGVFLHIFYNSLPRQSYTEINSIPDGAIPDVPMDAEFASEIYTFYRAGIVSGYTNTPGRAEHAFGADSGITRAEVASILLRMLQDESRTKFTIE